MIYICVRARLPWPLKVLTALLAATLTLAWPAAAENATISDFSLSGDGKATTFEASVSSDVGYAASVLPEPYRVVIDLANVGFDVPPGIGRKPKGLVKSVRYGIIEDGKSRIVVDTTGPVLIVKSVLLPTRGKRKARIVIELMAIPEDLFQAAFARDHVQSAEARDKIRAKIQARIQIAAAAKPSPAINSTDDMADTVGSISQTAGNGGKAKSRAGESAALVIPPRKPTGMPQQDDGEMVIVIDPGHGGVDPGAVSPAKTKEKDVVLAFARTLKAMLDAERRFKVVLTRNDDKFVSLKDRVTTAREEKADLFIAIHADIVRGQSVTGTTLYTLSETASDAEAEALAQKENRSDVIAGIDLGHQNQDVADILIDLVQRESRNHATTFSLQALRHLQPVTKMTGKPLRSAGFTVLKAPDVPSILIELGFLSNAKDEERLKSEAWRKTMAGALVAAISSYFSKQVALSP